MKKYMKICLLSIFPLILHGAETPSNSKQHRRISVPKALASSDGAAMQKKITEPIRQDLSRSQPIAIPRIKEPDFSPSLYYLGFGALSEKKNSYTPGNDSGR